MLNYYKIKRKEYLLIPLKCSIKSVRVKSLWPNKASIVRALK